MRSGAKILVLGCFGLSLSGSAWAQQQNYSNGASAVWALTAGTRALALGDAAGLLAGDATVLSQNPAALSFLNGGEAAFHHGVWDAGVAWDQVAAALPLGPADALGVSAALASYGSFERMDELGHSQGTYNASEALSAAGYSHRFGDLALGGSGFMTRQSIDKNVSLGYAWSAGFVWQPWSQLSLAGSLRSSTEVSGAGDLEGDLGLALHSEKDHGQAWGLALDSHQADQGGAQVQVAATRGFRGGAGIEGQLLGGYRFSVGQDPDRDNSHWSAGASLGWQAWVLDYTFVPMGQQEASHHFGLRYRFSGSLAPVKEEPRSIVAAPARNEALLKAQTLEASGQAVPALNAYAAAIALNASDLLAWKGMAKLYERLHRPDFAQRCWRAVAHLDPADPEALEALKK